MPLKNEVGFLFFSSFLAVGREEEVETPKNAASVPGQ